MTAKQLEQKLTVKEIKLVDGIVRGKTKRQAAIDAGYTGKTIETIGVTASQVLRKPNVQELLAQAFERHGITIDAATKPIADGLKAEKEQFDKDGETVGTSPDHSIRLKASGMAFNLMGIGKQTGDVTINFINHAQEQREIYDL
jgi:hypothetical protein